MEKGFEGMEAGQSYHEATDHQLHSGLTVYESMRKRICERNVEGTWKSFRETI